MFLLINLHCTVTEMCANSSKIPWGNKGINMQKTKKDGWKI